MQLSYQKPACDLAPRDKIARRPVPVDSFLTRCTAHSIPSNTMALCLGTILRGEKDHYCLIKQLGDKTVFNSLFKAEILPDVQTHPSLVSRIVLTFYSGSRGPQSTLGQRHAFRAPEVWTGIRCFTKADIFSAGALVSYAPSFFLRGLTKIRCCIGLILNSLATTTWRSRFIP